MRDALLETKDGLLKTENNIINIKKSVNICLQCTQEQ